MGLEPGTLCFPGRTLLHCTTSAACPLPSVALIAISWRAYLLSHVSEWAGRLHWLGTGQAVDFTRAIISYFCSKIGSEIWCFAESNVAGAVMDQHSASKAGKDGFEFHLAPRRRGSGVSCWLDICFLKFQIQCLWRSRRMRWFSCAPQIDVSFRKGLTSYFRGSCTT